MYTYFRNKLSFLKWCIKMFSSFADVKVAYQLSSNKAKQIKHKVMLHPRALGGKAINCRPGTTDWETFCSVFDKQFQLPPKECKHLSCIVDLGANVGYSSAHFACLYPQALIVALEMDADNYECARKNIQHWQDQVVLLHAAIWTVDGEVTYMSDAAQDAYMIQANHHKGDVPNMEFMKIASSITMKSLIQRFNLTHIDYLKVDIEGAESDLFLSGPLDWLNIVESLKIEIHRPQDMDKYYPVLASAGFTAYKDDHHWSTISAFRTSMR